MSDVTPSHSQEIQTPSVKKAKTKRSGGLSTVLIPLLLIAVIVLGGLYYQSTQQLSKLNSPEGQEELAKQEAKAVTDKLSKLALLPEEEPVVATILDVNMLASQSAFYKNAENGDKLVIYPQAQKAYIYSPGRNVIVNAGPLVVDQNENSRPVIFEVRDGSTNAADARNVKAELEKTQQVVVEISDASREDYSGTFIIPINPAIKPEQLKEFAENMDAEVMDKLPQGETASEADILIIVGEQPVTTSPAPETSPTP